SQTRDRAPTGLDEPCGVGPARDRLEPEGSGAGEEVEHRRTREIDPGVDRAEERLTATVGGGAGARRRGRQRPAPETTGDDAGHDVSSRSGPEQIGGRLGAGEPLHALGECWVSVQAGVGVQDLLGVATGDLDELAVVHYG